MPRRLGTTAKSRPFAAITRHTSRKSPAHLFAGLERVHHDDAVEGRVLERQLLFIGEAHQAGPRGRPMHHTLARRHHRRHPLGALAEGAEEGGGVADPEEAHARGVGPQRAHAAPDHSPRNLSQSGGVEVAEIDHILTHDRLS